MFTDRLPIVRRPLITPAGLSGYRGLKEKQAGPLRICLQPGPDTQRQGEHGVGVAKVEVDGHGKVVAAHRP